MLISGTGQNIEISGGGLLPHQQIHLTRRKKKTELHLLLTQLNLSPCLAMSKLKNQPNLSRIKPTNRRTRLSLKQLQQHWRLKKRIKRRLASRWLHPHQAMSHLLPSNATMAEGGNQIQTPTFRWTKGKQNTL